ncbi:MAG: hypothetical protein U0V04_10450 [Spirosomataceae bacterium]|jgi:hypothetical protein|nr:hypothetical protein [Bacteroidota bacterium]
MDRKIILEGRSLSLKSDQESLDFDYWQGKTKKERLESLFILIKQNVNSGQKMDKTYTKTFQMK